jgi:hypothetical protein
VIARRALIASPQLQRPDMAEREDLIWRMAEAIWRAHYCPHMGRYSECEGCRQMGECFELGADGFQQSESKDDWRYSAQAALEALETQLNLTFFPTQTDD